jgi:hypothetical protein
MQLAAAERYTVWSIAGEVLMPHRAKRIPVGHAFVPPESPKLDGLSFGIRGLIADSPKEGRRL